MSDTAGDRGHHNSGKTAPVDRSHVEVGGPDDPIPYRLVPEGASLESPSSFDWSGSGRPVDDVKVAPSWAHSPIYPQALAVYAAALRVLCEKFSDYGKSNIADAPGGAINGIVVRLWDKMSRVRNLVESGATPQNESLRDSFVDMMGYSAIALLVLDGAWPE